MITTVTLDTNVVREVWDVRSNASVVEKLIDLSKQGIIELAITNRIVDDIPRPPLSDRIRELPILNVRQIGAVFRLDHSALGDGDRLGSDTFLDKSAQIVSELARKGLGIPEWQDWDHIHGHYLAGRDVFLTFDRNVLAMAGELKDALGIVILSPREFLATILPGTDGEHSL